jgi:hypothetical protein
MLQRPISHVSTARSPERFENEEDEYFFLLLRTWSTSLRNIKMQFVPKDRYGNLIWILLRSLQTLLIDIISCFPIHHVFSIYSVSNFLSCHSNRLQMNCTSYLILLNAEYSPGNFSAASIGLEKLDKVYLPVSQYSRFLLFRPRFWGIALAR